MDITVVHRADESGTTENFTEQPAAAAPDLDPRRRRGLALRHRRRVRPADLRRRVADQLDRGCHHLRRRLAGRRARHRGRGAWARSTSSTPLDAAAQAVESACGAGRGRLRRARPRHRGSRRLPDRPRVVPHLPGKQYQNWRPRTSRRPSRPTSFSRPASPRPRALVGSARSPPAPAMRLACSPSMRSASRADSVHHLRRSRRRCSHRVTAPSDPVAALRRSTSIAALSFHPPGDQRRPGQTEEVIVTQTVSAEPKQVGFRGSAVAGPPVTRCSPTPRRCRRHHPPGAGIRRHLPGHRVALALWPQVFSNQDSIASADNFGQYVLPLMGGTVLASIIALILATPVAVGIALYISHYAPRKDRYLVGYVIDLRRDPLGRVRRLGQTFLAASMVPIYGWLHNNPGFIPFFAGDPDHRTHPAHLRRRARGDDPSIIVTSPPRDLHPDAQAPRGGGARARRDPDGHGSG